MTYLKEQAGFPIKKSLAVLSLPARTYYRWASMEGKKPRPEGILPKGHWILPEERDLQTGRLEGAGGSSGKGKDFLF